MNSSTIHLLAAGDIVYSMGTRSHIKALLENLSSQGIEVEVSFFQFRLPGMPEPSEGGFVHIPDFPCGVKCPSSVSAFNSLPRPLFRLYERLLLWRFLYGEIRKIKTGSGVILHGCLGALHLVPKTIERSRKWWLKLGLIEEESESGIRFVFRKWIERLNSKRFGKHLVVSQHMESFLVEEYCNSSEGCFVLPCLVNMEEFSSSINRQEARKGLGFQDRFVFLYLGTASPWQCAEETVDFFKRVRFHLPRAYLWVITPDLEYFGNILSSLSGEDYRLEFRRHYDLADWIQAADVGMLLRRRNLINRVASPVKLPEYLASGLPVVIGPEVGDYTDMVRGKRIGVVADPESPWEWDEAIDALFTLLSSEDQINQRCTDKARSLSWQSHSERIRKEFKWEN